MPAHQKKASSGEIEIHLSGVEGGHLKDFLDVASRAFDDEPSIQICIGAKKVRIVATSSSHGYMQIVSEFKRMPDPP